MRCLEARPLFPLYLDNAVNSNEMHAVADHLSGCAECQAEYRQLENTRVLVASLGRKPAPSDLALKIRVALSHERSRNWRGVLQGYIIRLENTVNAVMFPATAGVLTAVIFFGALAGFFVTPQVTADDVVPGLYMPARWQPPQTAMSAAADSELNLESPVVIQAYVDANGRVGSYEIIAGPDTEEIRSRLNRALLFTSFSPAYAFGQPVPGTAVICFSHMTVKG